MEKKIPIKESIAIVAALIIVGLFLVVPTFRHAFDALTLSSPEEVVGNTETGFLVVSTEEGEGESAKAGDIVVVHYKGMLPDGTLFDSSVGRGAPFSFTLGVGTVIKGWDLGVTGMMVGEKRTLTIPPELGYGGTPVGPIPPYSTLIFEVELLDIEKQDSQEQE